MSGNSDIKYLTIIKRMGVHYVDSGAAYCRSVTALLYCTFALQECDTKTQTLHASANEQ